LAIVSFSQAI
jgi:Tfp pilus assembly protein PilF